MYVMFIRTIDIVDILYINLLILVVSITYGPKLRLSHCAYKVCTGLIIPLTKHVPNVCSADEIYGDYREFRAIVTREGGIRWEPGGVFKTMCQIDITYFPFDEQACALVFGAWSYHTTKMNLSNSNTKINLDSYERNGEWEIITTKVL